MSGSTLVLSSETLPRRLIYCNFDSGRQDRSSSSVPLSGPTVGFTLTLHPPLLGSAYSLHLTEDSLWSSIILQNSSSYYSRPHDPFLFFPPLRPVPTFHHSENHEESVAYRTSIANHRARHIPVVSGSLRPSGYPRGGVST